MELLLAAGYFRVRIKGLSEFDKVTIAFSRVPFRIQTSTSLVGSRRTGLEYTSVQFHGGYRCSLSRERSTGSEIVGTISLSLLLSI
jgi:hypothetical protein